MSDLGNEAGLEDKLNPYCVCFNSSNYLFGMKPGTPVFTT